MFRLLGLGDTVQIHLFAATTDMRCVMNCTLVQSSSEGLELRLHIIQTKVL